MESCSKASFSKRKPYQRGLILRSECYLLQNTCEEPENHKQVIIVHPSRYKGDDTDQHHRSKERHFSTKPGMQYVPKTPFTNKVAFTSQINYVTFKCSNNVNNITQSRVSTLLNVSLTWSSKNILDVILLTHQPAVTQQRNPP